MASLNAKTLLRRTASLFLVLQQQVSAGPTVTVLNGTYEGYHLPSYKQDVFLGMPYAQPPVGNLRFRTPQSLNSSWEGSRAAVEYSDVCMQYVVSPLHMNIFHLGCHALLIKIQTLPSHSMSEDCLSLNVMRPSNYNGSEKLPVAVWIHG